MKRALRCAVILPLLSVSGCAGLTDPFQRPGTWHASDVNDDNLAAQVADPRDLISGRSDAGTPGMISAAAVRRLLDGQVRTLPSTDASSSTQSQQPQQQNQAPAALTGAGAGSGSAQ